MHRNYPKAMAESQNSAPAQLTLFEPQDIARPEYNIGKWAGIIFVSPYARNVSEERVFEWNTTYLENKAKASITITPLTGRKTPTVTTYKVYVALVQLWEQQGRDPKGMVSFSDRQLASQANWPYSGQIAKRIQEHIRILHGTSLSWTLSYKTENGVERMVSDMHIIEDSSYIERKIAFGSERFESNHWVRLNARTVENMLAKLEKPLNARELTSIQSHSSSSLYILLENFLAGKPTWERNARDLIYRDLNLDGVRYERSNNRLAFLEKIKEDLDGRALVRGTLSIAIYRNSADTDWKLVARKVLPKMRARTKSGIKPLLSPEAAEEVAFELIEQIIRQPNCGNPRHGYIAWLARYIPERVMQEAFSIAKSDYDPGNTKTTLTAVFIGILKRIAEEKGHKLPEKT